MDGKQEMDITYKESCSHGKCMWMLLPAKKKTFHAIWRKSLMQLIFTEGVNSRRLKHMKLCSIGADLFSDSKYMSHTAADLLYSGITANDSKQNV